MSHTAHLTGSQCSSQMPSLDSIPARSATADCAQPGALPRRPRSLCFWGHRDLPSSWTTPFPTCRALRPRRSAPPSPRRAAQCSLPEARSRRHRNVEDFGAQLHGPFARCLRFAVPVARATTQDSLPVRWLGFHRTGLAPAGLYSRIPSQLMVASLSSCPALPGATVPNPGSKRVRAGLRPATYGSDCGNTHG